VKPSELGEAVVSCPNGKAVTGGGGGVENSTLEVTYNGPQNGIAGWRIVAYNPSDGDANSVFYVWAICMNAS
jgi:hypothetical protein